MQYMHESKKMAGRKRNWIWAKRYQRRETNSGRTENVVEEKRTSVEALFYKEMQLKDRIPNMSEDEQIELLASDGMLVKRPILVQNEKVLVGFKEKEWQEIL